jgi:hypothetical protein
LQLIRKRIAERRTFEKREASHSTLATQNFRQLSECSRHLRGGIQQPRLRSVPKATKKMYQQETGRSLTAAQEQHACASKASVERTWCTRKPTRANLPKNANKKEDKK